MIKKAFLYITLIAVTSVAAIGVVWAIDVSPTDLKKMEAQVQKESIEHKKLQAQATQINM